jgi:hypothetical protein
MKLILVGISIGVKYHRRELSQENSNSTLKLAIVLSSGSTLGKALPNHGKRRLLSKPTHGHFSSLLGQKVTQGHTSSPTGEGVILHKKSFLVLPFLVDFFLEKYILQRAFPYMHVQKGMRQVIRSLGHFRTLLPRTTSRLPF